MSANFCRNCGAPLNSDSKFCENCGKAVENHFYNQPQYNTYQVVQFVKPKIPGRGMGISSLVLGIIGLVYSFAAFVSVLDMSPRVAENNIPSFIMFSILGILATTFGGVAVNRGYKNGVSYAGLITGIIAITGFLLAIIIAAS